MPRLASSFALFALVTIACGQVVSKGTFDGGNPVDASGGNPVDASGGNPVDASGGNPVDASGGNPVDASGGNQATLLIELSGAGSVSSMPSGIDCGSICSQAFDLGTKVTLTATPAPGGSFTRWSGGTCSGFGPCTVTLDASTTITAIFTCPNGSMTFKYTGGPQALVRPLCVTSITAYVRGAGGGAAVNNSTVLGGAGLGGFTQATLPIAVTDVLTVFVGGAGGDAISGVPGRGGFNGGADGNIGGGQAGGGGGGASDIRLNGMTLAERVVVAGAGGGAGSCGGSVVAGGVGGGLIGGGPVIGTCNGATVIATGGTQTAGGIGGKYSNFPQAGSGASGIAGAASPSTGGGGGGGGYYGGGGGAYHGGGGGSSFTVANATNVVHTPGLQSGNGEVTIMW